VQIGRRVHTATVVGRRTTVSGHADDDYPDLWHVRL